MPQPTGGITFNPRPGALLMCDYGRFASPREPEMTKNRPVVVVAQRSRRLCTVVPLSTVPPSPIRAWHRQIALTDAPSNLRRSPCWAKCDMVATVAYWRLDRCHERRPGGGRDYRHFQIEDRDLDAIRVCLAAAFGI